MKRPTYLLAFSVVSALFLLHFLFRGKDGETTTTTSVNVRPSSSQPLQTWDKDRPPKITIIAIWSIRGDTPPYLPYFIQGVEANPQVDLLFVQLDKVELGCPSYSKAPNIKELCLTEDQYYQLHVDFLCKRWQCAKEQESLILDVFKRNGETDDVNTYFRILRSGVFASYMDPATTIWGWCDVDEFWGNFTRTFPWDVAHDFDILVASSQPQFSNQRLLFMRGHMTFIRNSPEVLDKLHSYPKFSTLMNYLLLPPTDLVAEESEYSHYILSEDKSFTFMAFEAMSESHDTNLISPSGVFYIPVKKGALKDHRRRRRLAALVRPENKEPIRPTFSDEGIETKARVFEDGENFESEVWFDRKYITFVETGWVEPEERAQKAYFMRREPYGPITQRLEPRERYLLRDVELRIDECLYKHWQNEKRAEFFQRLPDSLAPGQIFVQHDNDQADIWDEFGHILYSTGR